MNAAAEPVVQAEAGSEAGRALVKIETKSGEFSFDCGADETILGAGLAAGYVLPYECATGTCGTCRARVMEGEVETGFADLPGWARLKRDKGDILMCQARPLGTCSLRVPSSQAQDPLPVQLRRTGRVEAVRKLTRDVAEFDVALSHPMNFEAGQFVTLLHPEIVGRRAYSMVNHAKDAHRLTFVVKHKPGGKFSDLVNAGSLEGRELDVLGPLGRATFRAGEPRDVLFIAGGSGIAGMMAMLRHATDENYFRGGSRGHVVFGVRTVQDAFYLEHFAEHVAAGNGALDVTIAISEESDVPDRHPDVPGIRLARGFVHEVAAAEIGDRWSGALAFVAGPKPMVDATITTLIKAGISPQSIKFDKFS